MIHTPVWRLLVYEAITQLIIILGVFRARIVRRQMVVRKDRVFDIYDREYEECCDCGLTHSRGFFPPGFDCGHAPVPGRKIIGHAFPERPDGYRYRLRAGAGSPSLAVPRRNS